MSASTNPTDKVERKCKCPFDHYKAPETRPTGSSVHPDIHEFDAVVEKFSLTTTHQYIIDTFKQFIQIPSISGDVPKDDAALGYRCCQFLGDLCDIWGIEYKFMEYTPNYPMFFAKIPGYDDSLTAIMCNNHYDVVPVIESKWNYPPFDAVEENDYIIGRGSQDDKCLTMFQFFAIVQSLINAYNAKHGTTSPDLTLDGTKNELKAQLGKMKLLRRTIVFASMPDEEVGGTLGMKEWVNTKKEDVLAKNEALGLVPEDRKYLVPYTDLNIEFFLDEGLASKHKKIVAFYNERLVWWLRVVANSTTGHGSLFIQDTAVEKLMCVINQLYAFRDAEFKRLHGEDRTAVGCEHAKSFLLGDVTTVNCTMLDAGVRSGADFAYNVIPPTARAGFDIRITQSVDVAEFEKMLRGMLPKGCEIEFVVKTPANGQKTASDADDKYWNVIRANCAKYGVELQEACFASATDGRLVTQVFPQTKRCGFTALYSSPEMLHDHDERLNKYQFIKGVEITADVIQDLAELQ